MILITGLLLAMSWNVRAEDNVDASPCMRRTQNARRISAAAKNGPDNERAPAACTEAIKKSYEACAKIPVEQKKKKDDGEDAGEAQQASTNEGEKAPPASIKGSGATLKLKSMEGKSKNLGKAKECEAERAKARQVCDDLNGQLKTAFENNGRERRDLEAKLGNDPKLRQKIQGYEETGHQLQAQMRNTKELTDASNSALEDYEKCFAADAQQNQLVADKADAIMASAGADGPPSNDAKIEEPESLTKKEKSGDQKSSICPVGSNSDNDLCVAGGMNMVNEAKVRGLKAGFQALASGSQPSAAATSRAVATAAAEGAAPSLFGRAASIIYRAAGPVGVYLSSTTSLNGPCADVYTNYFLAAQSGCPVSVNNATQALRP